MDGKRTALFYIVLILRASTSTPLESSTLHSVTASTLTSSSHPTDSPTSNDSVWNPFTIWGTAVGSIVFITFVLCFPSCLGFYPSGIGGGSLGADMMSYSAIANNGGVEAGGCVATCQSIGALGICSLGFFSATAIIVSGAGAGAALGFGIGFGLKKFVEFCTEHIFNGPTDAPNNLTVVDNSAAHLYPPLRFAANGTGESRLNVKGETDETPKVTSRTPLENEAASYLYSSVPPSDLPTSNNSIWNPFTIWGTVAGAVILTPIALCLPYCMGFAASGIRMGSLAASMMSCSGGGVVVGSCVAIFQSIGALGVCSLGFVPIGIIICINAAIGFGVGYVVLQLTNLIVKKFFKNEESSFPDDVTVTDEAERSYPDINTMGNRREESKFITEARELYKKDTFHSKHSSMTGSQTVEAETVERSNI